MILIGKGLRSFADGYVAVLLPAYLLALGFNQFEVGLLGTLTLAGSALATLAIGSLGHCWPHRRLLLAAALVMAATGIAFASLTSFWPLALIAFVGTLNPSSGDVSVFMPLEQARLANTADGESRTVLFSYYTVTGSLCAAVGALASGLPVWFSTAGGVALLDARDGFFVMFFKCFNFRTETLQILISLIEEMLILRGFERKAKRQDDQRCNQSPHPSVDHGVYTPNV